MVVGETNESSESSESKAQAQALGRPQVYLEMSEAQFKECQEQRRVLYLKWVVELEEQGIPRLLKPLRRVALSMTTMKHIMQMHSYLAYVQQAIALMDDPQDQVAQRIVQGSGLSPLMCCKTFIKFAVDRMADLRSSSDYARYFVIDKLVKAFGKERIKQIMA